MVGTSSIERAQRLLLELLQIDEQPLAEPILRRRSEVRGELMDWALELARSRAEARGALPSERAHPRVELRLPLQLRDRTGESAVTHSLGTGGLSADFESCPTVGERLHVALTPESDTVVISATAEVVWVDARRGRAGMRFVDVPPSSRAGIDRLVFSSLVAAERWG